MGESQFKTGIFPQNARIFLTCTVQTVPGVASLALARITAVRVCAVSVGVARSAGSAFVDV